MDILSEFLTKLCLEFGSEMLDQNKLHQFELKFRTQNGGDRYYIASADACQRAQRNAEVARLIKAGEPINALAERFNLTERQIRNIKKLVS